MKITASHSLKAFGVIILLIAASNAFSQRLANGISKSSFMNTVNRGDSLVIVEAESGIKGSNISVLLDGTVKYVTPKVDFSGQIGSGDTSRMITYQVTLRDSGHLIEYQNKLHRNH